MTTPPDDDPALNDPGPDGSAVDAPDPPGELERLAAHVAEVESLVRTVAWGVGHETTELKAALEALAARVDVLEPAAVDDEPEPEPQAWVDYATAQDWQALAGWVDWLVCTYDFQPSRTVLPCWPAHRGVVEELAALRAAWRMAATAGRAKKPNDALILWHDRWLHPCVQRLRENFQQKSCTDRHDQTRPGRATNPGLLATALVDAAERAASATSTPEPAVDPGTGELL